MRTAVMCFTLALAAMAPLRAQQRETTFGLAVGWNRSTATGIGPVDGGGSGQLSAFADFPLGKRWFSIRPEISVVRQRFGADFPAPGSDGPVQESLESTWLQVPVTARASFPSAIAGRVTPSLHAGAFMGVRLACNLDLVFANGLEPLSLTESSSCQGYTTTFNTGDAGFVVGGGLGMGPVNLNLRWTRSLMSVAQFSAFGTNTFSNARASTLSVAVEVFGSLAR